MYGNEQKMGRITTEKNPLAIRLKYRKKVNHESFQQFFGIFNLSTKKVENILNVQMTTEHSNMMHNFPFVSIQFK